MMTLSIICGFLPTLFISPFAGVWADRYSRKMLIVLSDTLTALSTLALIILFFMGYSSIWLLFGASALRSIGAGVQTPAVGAFLPQIVPEDKLTKVNGINSSIQSLVAIVSPLLSGALLSVTTIKAVFFVDVITAAVAVFIMLVFLHVPLHAKAREKQKLSYFNDMSEGLKFIINHKFLKTLFIHCGVYFVLVSPLAFLTPLQVARSFGNDVWRLTVIEVAYSAGMTAGGIIIAAWGGFKNRLHSMALSNIVCAVCTLALGIISNFLIYSLLMVIIGLTLPIFSTPFMVVLQEKVEGDFLGRVFGVLNMISSSVMPIAMLVFGPLADILKIEWMLIVTGLLMIIQTIFMIKSRVLIEAGKQSSLEC